MPSSGCQTCALDRKSTRLNSSHGSISNAVFCLKKKKERALNLVLTIKYKQAPKDSTEQISYALIKTVDNTTVFTNGNPNKFFFFNKTATPEIYPLPLPDALPIFFVRPDFAAADRVARARHTGIERADRRDRKSTRLNSSHGSISYAGFCLKQKLRFLLARTQHYSPMHRTLSPSNCPL